MCGSSRYTKECNPIFKKFNPKATTGTSFFSRQLFREAVPSQGERISAVLAPDTSGLQFGTAVCAALGKEGSLSGSSLTRGGQTLGPLTGLWGGLQWADARAELRKHLAPYLTHAGVQRKGSCAAAVVKPAHRCSGN